MVFNIHTENQNGMAVDSNSTQGESMSNAHSIAKNMSTWLNHRNAIRSKKAIYNTRKDNEKRGDDL